MIKEVTQFMLSLKNPKETDIFETEHGSFKKGLIFAVLNFCALRFCTSCQKYHSNLYFPKSVYCARIFSQMNKELLPHIICKIYFMNFLIHFFGKLKSAKNLRRPFFSLSFLSCLECHFK